MPLRNEITNIHIYPSHFQNESRILREARALLDLNLVTKIQLIGIWKNGLPTRETLSPSIELIRIESGFGKVQHWKWLNVFSFFIFYCKTFWFIARQKPNIINVHALTVLPLGATAKLFTKTRLIYDAHELETETNDSRGLRKVVAKIIETLFIRAADSVIVVSPSIKTWYEKKYNIHHIEVIKNISESKVNTNHAGFIRSHLNIPENHLVFLYAGALINGRGIEKCLNVFKKVSADKHIVFMGYGQLESMIREESAQHQNIHFLQAVDTALVVGISSGANVGLSLIESSCLSYYYCLPNKVYEYAAAGIPFICSNLPDIRSEFNSFNVCWFVDSETELLECITTINKDMIEQKHKNVLTHQSRWQWNDERQKYVPLYRNLISELSV